MSRYEINVAQRASNGRYVHLFATAERSLPDEASAREAYALIASRFPAPQFHVSVTRWERVGEELNWDAKRA